MPQIATDNLVKLAYGYLKIQGEPRLSEKKESCDVARLWAHNVNETLVSLFFLFLDFLDMLVDFLDAVLEMGLHRFKPLDAGLFASTH